MKERSQQTVEVTGFGTSDGEHRKDDTDLECGVVCRAHKYKADRLSRGLTIHGLSNVRRGCGRRSVAYARLRNASDVLHFAVLLCSGRRSDTCARLENVSSVRKAGLRIVIPVSPLP